MTADRTLIDRAAVAARLGHTVSWLYNNERALLEKEGFPPPAIGRRSGARWDPAAINAWLDRRIAAAPLHPAAPAAAADAAALIAEETAELNRRSAALAAGGRRRNG